MTTAPPRGRVLGEVLHPTRNGLNLVRLVLASSVIFWHSFPLTGTPFPWAPGAPFAGGVAVDGFFALSGFLLAGSWLHRPHVVSYVRNRVLRIVPAFWVCLVVVAFVFAPLGALLAGQEVSALFSGPHSAWRFVLENSALRMRFYDVAGTPAGVPFPGVWNGSLWTLWWEALAYVGLLAIGLAGILRRRPLVLVVLGAVWVANASLSLDLIPHGYYQDRAGRLGLMFLCGVAFSVYRDVVPVGRWWVLAAVAVIPVSLALPDFRVLAAPFVAYLCLVAGASVRRPSLQLHDRDISYGMYIYGFPVQQAVVLAGAATWSPLALAVTALVLTVPLAAASWILVERPALRLKARRPSTDRA
ncbi:acyltransferase family protein [Solicola sp. PLA-1-18]|uniref:acyltransferase family protein n=1 Tax=Solicola sp. PLA-1-18 TaxID=3380532 RepID=UPI003B800597